MLTPQQRLPANEATSNPGVTATEVGWDPTQVARLIRELSAVHAEQRAAETRMEAELESVPSDRRPGARNLLHSLALRSRERAECIMLNKGPHVAQAVRCLDDIIRRMETHQAKKMPTLRPLRVASEAFARKG